MLLVSVDRTIVAALRNGQKSVVVVVLVVLLCCCGYFAGLLLPLIIGLSGVKVNTVEDETDQRDPNIL